MSSTPTFHPLERVANLRDGYLRTFIAGGIDLVLVQQAGVPAILEGICPHAGHPFSDSRVIGALGVIGPTRLNYARVVPMVDYTAKVVGRMGASALTAM